MPQYAVDMSNKTKAQLAFLSRYYEVPMRKIANDLLAAAINNEFNHVLDELKEKQVISEDEAEQVRQDVLLAGES